MKLSKLNTSAIILVIFAFLTGVIKHIILFYLPVIYDSFGFSSLQIGLIMGLSLFSYILLATPIGILCDREDIRKIFAGAVILWIIFFAGMSLTNSAILAIILIFFFRIGNLTSATALKAILLKMEHKFKNELIGTFNFLLMLGVVAGMLLGGYLLGSIGIQHTFIVVGVGLLPLILLSFLLPKTKRSKEKIKAYKQDIFSKKFIILAVILLLYSLHYGAENVSYGLFLKYNLHLSFSHIGLYMATGIFLASFITLLTGLKATKENNIQLFILGMLLSGLGHILMVQNNVYISLLFRIVHEFGDAIYFSSFAILIKDIFKMGRIGGNTGTFSVILATGSIIGSIGFSLINPFGYQWPLIISGVIILISATLLLINRRIFYETKSIHFRT